MEGNIKDPEKKAVGGLSSRLISQPTEVDDVDAIETATNSAQTTVPPSQLEGRPAAEVEDQSGASSPLFGEGGFAWLSNLKADRDGEGENRPAPSAGAKLSPRDGNEKILDFADYRPNTPARHDPAKQDADRLDLERRLTALRADEDLDIPEGMPQNSRMETMKPERQGMMASIFPYIAATFFFAIIAAGAIFYFVAIKIPAPESPMATARAPVAETETPSSAKPSEAARTEPAAEPTQRVVINAASGPFKAGGGSQSSGSGSNVFAAFPGATSPSPNTFAAAAIANLRGTSGAPASTGRAGVPLESKIEPQEITAEPVVKETAVSSRESSSRESSSRESSSAVPLALPASPPAANKEPDPVSPAAVSSPQTPVSPSAALAGSRDETPPAAKPASSRVASLPPSLPVEKPSRAQKPIRPQLSMPPEQEAEFLDRAKTTLREGDIAGSRLLFQYLVDQGSANGAFMMGQTYDQAVLSKLRIRGVKGESKTARRWYERAAEMGSADAASMLSSSARP